MRTLLALALLLTAFAGCTDDPEPNVDDSEPNGGMDQNETMEPQTNQTAPPGNSTTPPEGNETTEPDNNQTQPPAPVAAEETYYLHAEGTAQDQTSMDHNPAAGQEEGSHTALVAQPADGGYHYKFPSTEPTLFNHAAGSDVTVIFRAYTIAPHPAVTITAALTAGADSVGSGSDTQLVPTMYSAGTAPTTDCVEFTITFASQMEVAAGTDLSLDVSTDYPLNLFPCFEGGTETTRLVLAA